MTQTTRLPAFIPTLWCQWAAVALALLQLVCSGRARPVDVDAPATDPPPSDQTPNHGGSCASCVNTVSNAAGVFANSQDQTIVVICCVLAVLGIIGCYIRYKKQKKKDVEAKIKAAQYHDLQTIPA